MLFTAGNRTERKVNGTLTMIFKIENISIGPKRFGLDQTHLDMNHNSSTKSFGADQICFGPKVIILQKDKTNIKDPFYLCLHQFLLISQ